MSKIKEYAKNAKKHSDDQVQAIANSIKKFGFRQPIVLDAGFEIIIGHGRFEAAKRIGMTEVPCVMADDLTEAQVKALRIADNKTNESDWDLDLLAGELGELADFDMTDLGFNEAEILELTIDDSPADAFPGASSQAASGLDGEYQAQTYGHGVEYNSDSADGAHVPAEYMAPHDSEPSKEEISYYAQKAEQTLTRRVIIVYSTEEEETFLKKLLAQDDEKPLGVVLDVKMIMKARKRAENDPDEETAG